ncbi:hypothetical protein [Tomitella fengzijianii]|uniref:Uncharacterized protein n=1 Tax=Tomitella fengzijianii TaxID=2597660 RepID=A0A516X5J7_9ACTN|nr:hypothetical protein [Tomitella fengzijianii]QDQ97951.1 hypothetical protein FO059_12305 [Tomitella fengzijianii]
MSTDPIRTAQRAHHDLDLAASMARHPAGRRRPFVRPEDRAQPRRIEPAGSPADFDRPTRGTYAVAAVLSLVGGALVGACLYAAFAGWAGPL